MPINIFNRLDGIISSKMSPRKLGLTDAEIWLMQKYAETQDPEIRYGMHSFTSVWKKPWSLINPSEGFDCAFCKIKYPHLEDMFVVNYDIDPETLEYKQIYYCPCCTDMFINGQLHFSDFLTCDFCNRIFRTDNDSYVPLGFSLEFRNNKPIYENTYGETENRQDSRNICLDCLKKIVDIHSFLGMEDNEGILAVLHGSFSKVNGERHYFRGWEAKNRGDYEDPGMIKIHKSLKEILSDLGIFSVSPGRTNAGYDSEDTYNDKISSVIEMFNPVYREFDRWPINTNKQVFSVAEGLLEYFMDDEFRQDEIIKKSMLEINPNENSNGYIISMVIPNLNQAPVYKDFIEDNIREALDFKEKFGIDDQKSLVFYPKQYEKTIANLRRSDYMFSKKDYNALGIWSITADAKTGDIDVEVDKDEDGNEIIGIVFEILINIKKYRGDPFGDLDKCLYWN